MNVQQMEAAKAKTPQAPPVNSGVWTGLLIVGFVSIASLIFTALVGWAWRKHDNAAAWLQAIGAIVGIGIAVAVPAWQHRTTVRREAERAPWTCRGSRRIGPLPPHDETPRGTSKQAARSGRGPALLALPREPTTLCRPEGAIAAP